MIHDALTLIGMGLVVLLVAVLRSSRPRPVIGSRIRLSPRHTSRT